MNKVAFFAEIKKGKVSGPTNSVTLLSKYLYTQGVCSDVFSIVNQCGVAEVNGQTISELSNFYENIKQYDLCVLEGAFRPAMWKIALVCVIKRKKYIVSPRSNLMRTSFKKGFLKKILSLFVVFPYFRMSSAVHYLNVEEYENSFFFGKKALFAKNGTDCLDRELLTTQNKNQTGNDVLFVGRYDINHKGLDNIVDFVKKNKTYLLENKFRFHFYGADFRNEKSKFEELVSRKGIQDLVTINGPVFGQEKYELMQNHRFFIHGSRYEGQPQAVLEAIQCGCIPIVTNECNLRNQIKELGYGFIWSKNMKAQDFIFECQNSSVVPSALNQFKFNNSWEVASEEFKKIIEKVLKNG